MRKLLAVITLIGFTTMISASPVHHPLGSNLTFGDVAHGQSVMSGIHNPAAGATAIRDQRDSAQFSVWTGFGIGYEIGEFDNLQDEIDIYADAFETGGIVGSSKSQVANELNGILSQIEAEGYAKALSTFQLPIVPIIVSSDLLGGSLVFDAYISTTRNVNLFYEQVVESAVTTIGSRYIVTGNDTTLLFKAATIQALSLGYSRLISSTSIGGIYAGIRGQYLKVGLVQANERLDAGTNFKQSFDDIGKDDVNYSTNFGIDIGLLLISKYYRLGGTLTNLNEPSYEYNAITDPDDRYTKSGDVYQRLIMETTYTMETQLKLEAALFSQNEHWVMGLGIDTNSIADGVGDDYQWATVSAAYFSNSWILPVVRMGLRQNLAGSELSFVTGGLTLFDFLNLDIAYGLEKVEVDGESQPRSAMINLGLELTF